jgi:cation:H+ antiporter
MVGEIFFLFAGLFMIFLSSEGFTNGVEVFGSRFRLSKAVVGSLLAAVGTALPETILPVVAIFFYGGKAANDIGIGAILGAPFMLSTLAFFLVGLTVLAAFLKKKRRFELIVETSSTRRDLLFFLPMYSAAVFAPVFAGRIFSAFVAVALVIGYVFYAYRTLRSESEDIEQFEELHLLKLLRNVRAGRLPLILILLQVVICLAVMIFGAHIFVESLESVSVRFGMNPLLFALLLAPVATELPEKINSITWTWKGRDTLAIGNITGAMVFQATFPVSVGLLFTDWKLTGMAFFSALIALLSVFVVMMELTFKKRLSPVTMFFGGILYLVYAALLVAGGNQWIRWPAG